MYMNRIYFAGNVGDDAEHFVTTGGTRIVSFSLCYHRKGKDGRPDTKAWRRVKVFGNWCDYAVKFKKGNNVFVEGELVVSSYKDKTTGAEKTAEYIIANSLALIANDKRDSKAGDASTPSDVDYSRFADPTDDDLPF